MRDSDLGGGTDSFDGTAWDNTTAFLGDVYNVAIDSANPDKFISDPAQIAKDYDVLAQNAMYNNMTTEQYIASRGGVNSSGYYGDSYVEGRNLNPLEYAQALQGGVGSLNAAIAAKEAAYNLAHGIEPRRGRRNLDPSLSDGGATPPTPPPPPRPDPPPPPIKTAPIDAILFDNSSIAIEIMADLIFENIGGQELINIARNDTINGQKIIYQPIKNLGVIQRAYNPNNILGLQQTSDQYFQNFPIKLEEKVPEIGNGPNGETVYIDSQTGDLIIELVNMLEGEQVESQISTGGTIYEGNI
jgi:hypothetical protein